MINSPALNLDNCRVEWIDGNTKKSHIDTVVEEIQKSSVELMVQEAKGSKPEKMIRVIGLRVKGATVAEQGLIPRHLVISIGRPSDYPEDLSEPSDEEESDEEETVKQGELDRTGGRVGGRRIFKFFSHLNEWKVVPETPDDRAPNKRYFIYIFNLCNFQSFPDQLIAIFQDEDITKASHYAINDMKSLAKAVEALPLPSSRQYMDVNMLVSWTLENDCFTKYGLNDLLLHTLKVFMPHKMRAYDEDGYSRIPKNTIQPEEAALETLAYLRLCEFCFERLIEDEKANKVKIDEIRKAFKRLKFVSAPCA